MIERQRLSRILAPVFAAMVGTLLLLGLLSGLALASPGLCPLGVVMTKIPDANIRIDLLVIWPVVLVVSGWFVFKALRRL